MVCQAASWRGWSRRSSFRNEANGPSGVSERTGSGRICWTWLKRKVVRLGLMVQPERVTAACQARRVSREDLLDLVEEEGAEAGVDGPAGAGDGGVPGAAGGEGQEERQRARGGGNGRGSVRD